MVMGQSSILVKSDESVRETRDKLKREKLTKHINFHIGIAYEF